jgi:hypothetical protein
LTITQFSWIKNGLHLIPLSDAAIMVITHAMINHLQYGNSIHTWNVKLKVCTNSVHRIREITAIHRRHFVIVHCYCYSCISWFCFLCVRYYGGEKCKFSLHEKKMILEVLNKCNIAR